MKGTDIIGVARHRIQSDGCGIRTLVAFHGCPLRCRYCLNPHCLSKNGKRTVSFDYIADEVYKDELYYKVTNGGVTFGGGEPLLHSDDMLRLITEYGFDEWSIDIETSLNVNVSELEKVYGYIDKWYIDIKDMNPVIYKNYTGIDNHKVKDNLKWLLEHGVCVEDVIIRVPLIAGYNTEDDIRNSIRELKDIGFSRFDVFKYKVEEDCQND